MLESIESFYKKDKYFKDLFYLYKDELDTFYHKAEKQVVHKEFARGGEVIHRGFYCPSPVQDIIIGNCNRGRLIKNPRKTPDYEYGFDKDGRIILVKQFCVYDTEISPTIELLFYNSNTVNSILYQRNKNLENEFCISALTKCIYENGFIKNYDFAEIFDPSENRTEELRKLRKNCRKIELKFTNELEKNDALKPFIREYKCDDNNFEAEICNNIKTENFEYNDNIIASSTWESYNFDIKIISQSKYLYNYDDNKKIISYTVEEYDDGKGVSNMIENHTYKL